MNDVIRDTLLAPVYDVAIETPLQHSAKLSRLSGNDVYLKREDMQPIHSFKIRGAYNKIIGLSDSERAAGIIAASAGNHAQGVAFSAQKLGIKATIIMPRTTPAIKIEAVESFGAEVVLAGDNYSEAYLACLELMTQSGKTLVHPFDDPAVIAGQGTVGKEIIEQLPHADYIFVPVGGGGLIAGIAQYVKQLRPGIVIIGVEPDDSNAMGASLKAGERIVLPHVGVFADGVAVKQVGQLPYAICRQYVDDIITINNDQICAAIKYIYETTRSIVEPAGALSVAGALHYATARKLSGRQLVAICSGANIAFERLQFVAERTLLGSGRELLFSVQLPEKPGALAAFCTKVVNGHNITEFCYRLNNRQAAHVLVGITVSGSHDKVIFMQKLQRHNYQSSDLSGDDITKAHIRHMIGGQSPVAEEEKLYEITFPERPRALADFLETLGSNWNISLFHYRGLGGDTGSVLIGFEAPDTDVLQTHLQSAGYDFQTVTTPAAATFL